MTSFFRKMANFLPRPGVHPARGDVSGESMRGVNNYWRRVMLGADDSHRECVGGLWDVIGPLQLEFMKSVGLKPGHRLLDVGCGCLRGGIHFIRYLEAGNYYGLDINSSLIEAARVEIDRAGLASQAPQLLVDDGFRFSKFGVTFDYGIAISVFTHLFANHMTRCLAEIRRVMHPESRFYFSFFRAPAACHLDSLVHSPGDIRSYFDADPFHYAVEELERLAEPLGLAVEDIGDWKHPRAQQMACVRLR